MKTVLRLVMMLAVMEGTGFAQTAVVTGQIVDPSSGAAYKNVSVEFLLKGCGGNPPRINGSSLLTGDSNGADIAVTFPLNSSGQIVSKTGGTATIVRSDYITCGTNSDTNTWVMTIIRNGARGAPCSVRIVSSTFDATQPACIGAMAGRELDPSVLTALAYLRVDATNGPVTGNLRTKKFNDIRFADQYGVTAAAGSTAACADLAGAIGVVAIPSSMGTGTYGAIQENCSVVDERGTGGVNQYGTYETATRTGGVNMYSTSTTDTTTNETRSQVSLFTEVNGGHNDVGNKSNYNQMEVKTLGGGLGQKASIWANLQHQGMGDAVGIIGKTEGLGGIDTGGDEGSIGVYGATYQDNAVFSGTAGTPTGNVIPYTTVGADYGLGVRRPLIVSSPVAYSTGTACASTTSSCPGTANGSTTIFGVGTTWTGLAGVATDYCFSLDAAEHNSMKLVFPVTAITDNTHLTIAAVWPTAETNAAGTYKIFKCSNITAFDRAADTITVAKGSLFANGNTIENPASYQQEQSALKGALRPFIASSRGRYILTGNTGSFGTDTYSRATAAIAMLGNTVTQIDFTSNGTAPSIGYRLCNSAPCPRTWFVGTDNVNNSVHTFISLSKNSGTFSINYDKSTNLLDFNSQASFVVAASGSSAAEFSVQVAGVPDFRVGSAITMFNNTNDAVWYSADQSGEVARVAGATGNITTSGSIQVGGGTAIIKVVKYAAALSGGSAPASVGATTCAEQTFAVSGLTTADIVQVNGPAPTAGLGIAGVRVSAADTLAIVWCNPTAGGLTPTAGTYNIIATRF